MDFAFGLYRDFGLLINIFVLTGLFSASFSYKKIEFSRARAAHSLHSVWLLASLGAIALLTLTPVQRGPGLGFPALQPTHLATQVVTSHNSGFTWPDWHDPVANILMMVPLATALGVKWPPRRVIVCIAALSGGIECTQRLIGHGRTAQLSDVILNSIGGLLGVVITLTVHRLYSRLD